MEIQSYKIVNADTLLDEHVIINNIIETSKINDPFYIMSASTAWLRKHKGKTLYDLQQLFLQLNLATMILSVENKEKQRLCVPGNPDLEPSLKYEAKFICSPLMVTQAHKLNINNEALCHTGYSCSSNYKEDYPQIESLHQSETEIHQQLQWAAIQFTVKYIVVNPDDELKKDLACLDETSYHKKTLFKTGNETIYVYVDNNSLKCVTEYGVIVKPSQDGKAFSSLVVHLPTYLNT